MWGDQSHPIQNISTGSRRLPLQLQEALIVSVIQITNNSKLRIIPEAVQGIGKFIPPFVTRTCHEIIHPSFLHVLFHPQVKYHFLIPVINSGQTCQIGFTFISSQLLHHFHRQIFQGSFRIVRKELFAVYQYLLNFLTMNQQLSITIYLSTRQLFYKIFEHRTFGGTIGRGIEDRGILFGNCQRSFTHHYRFAQQNAIGK